MVESPYFRRYLFTALQGSPDLFDHLLQNLSEEAADLRPDPDRFTIREIMAHLADWEDIFLQRMIRTREEDRPVLADMDEGQRALDQNYAATDFAEQTHLFYRRRETTVAFLESLSPEEWQRVCLRPEIGNVAIETIALLLPLHDSYHLQQIRQWRAAEK